MDLSIFQGPFSVAPCDPNITIRNFHRCTPLRCVALGSTPTDDENAEAGASQTHSLEVYNTVTHGAAARMR